MFEFNQTKELTTKGVGLGLHISKLISEQLGGDIDCRSVWQEGTVMTFVIACEEKKSSHKEIKRIQNPVGVRYPKFEMKIDQFECPEVQRRQTNMALENMINKTPFKRRENDYSMIKVQGKTDSEPQISLQSDPL